QTINLLKTVGRLVIISFHSLEDRIVKNFLKNESNPTEKFNKIFNNKYTKQIPINLLQQNENIQNMQINNATIKLISKAVKPTENEILNNPRARSSILRIAEKL
ncbi:MAG: 16S rRNA (cytosine(1402)-N(4))-methyltransferase, partial [Rhodocyclaceae bacterium]